MTFCGFAINDGVAWAWADSEAFYKDGSIDEDVDKLAIFADGAVIVGCGWSYLNSDVRSHAKGMRSTSFEVAAVSMALKARLLSKERRRDFLEHGERYEALSEFGLVGLQDGRLRGLTMFEQDDFRQRDADKWGSQGFKDKPQSASDVYAIALRQREIVRRSYPWCTGRALTIAKIGLRGVAITTLRLDGNARAPPPAL